LRNYLIFSTADHRYLLVRVQVVVGGWIMSIWSELLFLHGHLTHVPGPGATADRPSPREVAEEVDRLKDLIGCPSPGPRRPEPRAPLLGVKGLA